MHELSLTRSVVTLCSEHAEGRRVLRVALEIGELSCVMPEAMQFCFEACARGTVLEGATLDIVRKPGRARCRRCGAEFALSPCGTACNCGGRDLEVLAGEELKVREIEVDDICHPAGAT